MPSHRYYFFLVALLILPDPASGTTIHRCEAPDGHLTFTTLSCAHGHSLSLQEVRAYPPGSAVALIPDREFAQFPLPQPQLTVVGQAEDKCGNLLSPRERREALINQRMVAGLSQQDVESALGKPDSISIRNSSTTWRYAPKRGRSALVQFDEKGCIAEKGKSRTAKSPL
ncbi:cell envelope protein SmpA [Pseudomonas sp. LB3P31]